MATEAGQQHAIDTMLLEERTYPPPEDFAAQANAQPDIYDLPFEEFWEREGRERVTWFEPFTELYEWDVPYAKFFETSASTTTEPSPSQNPPYVENAVAPKTLRLRNSHIPASS